MRQEHGVNVETELLLFLKGYSLALKKYLCVRMRVYVCACACSRACVLAFVLAFKLVCALIHRRT